MYKTIILPVDCIGVKLQNMMLKEIVGPEREKVAGGWRELHDEKLHNLYSSPNIIRMISSKRLR
jgi:hypothetical protein